MTVYARPGAAEALMSYESRYGNFIGGEWFAPVGGEYFENSTPVTGQPFCEVARSNEADVDKALDAAHGAASQWASTAPAERANILNKIVVPRLPAHAAFGAYKQSGIGRENHKMMLDHYQQTKNLLVSYSNKAQGFF